jgi:uncharacterized membrane protein
MKKITMVRLVKLRLGIFLKSFLGSRKNDLGVKELNFSLFTNVNKKRISFLQNLSKEDLTGFETKVSLVRTEVCLDLLFKIIIYHPKV